MTECGEVNGFGGRVEIGDRIRAVIGRNNEPVRTTAAGENIVSGTAGYDVIATAAVQGVVATETGNRIVAAQPGDDICGGSAGQQIVAAGTKLGTVNIAQTGCRIGHGGIECCIGITGDDCRQIIALRGGDNIRGGRTLRDDRHLRGGLQNSSSRTGCVRIAVQYLV